MLRPALPETPPGDRFSERRIGLDHLAAGVTGRVKLDWLAEALRGHCVPAGRHHDPPGPAMVTFRDPGNIQWEFFEQ